jgi:hypothetical protein
VDDQPPDFVKAIRRSSSGLLTRENIEQYRKLDPGNARLNAFHDDTIQRGA